MKRALCPALCTCLALLLASCKAPPEGREGERPERAAQKAPPKEAPRPKLRAATKLFLFLPHERRCYVAGETAEVSLVVDTPAKASDVAVELSLTNESGATWKATEALATLPKGRHTLTYGITVGDFPPGSYTLAAGIAGESFGTQKLVFVPSVPQTHYPIAAWLDKPPRSELDVARWTRALGLNTVLLQYRTPWRSSGAHVVDAKYKAACKRVRTTPGARPLELSWAAPPFVQTADLLTGAGLRWLDCCAVSGGKVRLQPQRDLSDPMVASGGRQRVHHQLMAERRFRNCIGLHLTDETTLSTVHSAVYRGPFGVPAQIDGFKKRFGLKKVPWREGAKQWDLWEKFLLYRPRAYGETLAQWAGAVRAAGPRYLATSSLYEPMSLGAGAYPPLQAKGLPIISTHVPLDGPAGMMMSAIAADLQRAGNWDKALWMMPLVAPEADLDELRTSVNLAIARKLDGVVYPPALDYRLDRPGASQLSTDLLAGISGVNAVLTRLGDFFLALEKTRDNVAIFYSRTEHIARIGKDPVKDPRAADYPWTLVGAYQACMTAHYPATFLTEEELLAGEGAKSKVVLLIGLTRIRPQVKARLEALAAGGVAVLTDPTTSLELKGALPIAIAFPDLSKYHEELGKAGEKAKVDPTRERRDEVVIQKLIMPLLTRLRTELRKHIKRDYTVKDHGAMICEQRCGAARYIFVVNNRQRVDFFRGLKWELTPISTQVTLREGDYVIYDVKAGSILIPPRIDKRPVIQRNYPAGGMEIFALVPKTIGGVRITRARLGDGGLAVEAYVYGGRPTRPDALSEPFAYLGSLFWGKKRTEPMNAAVPIEVTLHDPTGAERLKLYRAHRPGGYKETIPLPRLETPGKWKLVIREGFSGRSAEETFRVRPPRRQRWARRLDHLLVLDGDRIGRLLRSSKPLWIVVGTAAEAKKAQPLAAALRFGERSVEIKLAADVAKPRKLSEAQARRYVSATPANAAMPDIRRPAILIGKLSTHPLLQTVHNYGILPRTVTPDYPGRGGALLCWLLSAFEPGVEVVVATAGDDPGVERAIQALRRAARRAAPRTAWRPVACAAVATKPKPKAEIKRLVPTWRRTMLDSPTVAKAPLSGETFALAFNDGRVVGFDSIGKLAWSRQCPSRVRDIAVSHDGAWTAVASFPAALHLTTRGSVHWAVPVEESFLRADFTAVAMSLDGKLTVCGTRHGRVLGIDFEGRTSFSVGVPAADEEIDPEKTRLGAIGAIAISPRLDVDLVDLVVVAAERETIGLDPKSGNELWASKALRRASCVAISMPVPGREEPAIAVGSRGGFVARVTKDGVVKWRKPVGGYILSVCFLGTTDKTLAASVDGTLVCLGPDGERLWSHRCPVGYRLVASSLDGETIAAAELAGRAVLLNKDGQVFAETDRLAGMIRAMALSADGSRLIVGTSTNQVSYYKQERPKPQEDEL